MLLTSMEKSCQIPFLTLNHSDSVPTTLTLASCFLYSLVSRSIKCRGYPMSIMVTQSSSCEIESNAYLKSTKHMLLLVVLTCLMHQYSEIRDLVSCPPSLSESCSSSAISISFFTQILSRVIRRRILFACETRAIVL